MFVGHPPRSAEALMVSSVPLGLAVVGAVGAAGALGARAGAPAAGGGCPNGLSEKPAGRPPINMLHPAQGINPGFACGKNQAYCFPSSM